MKRREEDKRRSEESRKERQESNVEWREMEERKEKDRQTDRQRGGQNELFIPDCSSNIKSNLKRQRREVERVCWGTR